MESPDTSKGTPDTSKGTQIIDNVEMTTVWTDVVQFINRNKDDRLVHFEWTLTNGYTQTETFRVQSEARVPLPVRWLATNQTGAARMTGVQAAPFEGTVEMQAEIGINIPANTAASLTNHTSEYVYVALRYRLSYRLERGFGPNPVTFNRVLEPHRRLDFIDPQFYPVSDLTVLAAERIRTDLTRP